MNPIVLSLLKELAKTAIPLIATKLVNMIGEDGMASHKLSLPTTNNQINNSSSYMDFSDIELESIINEFKFNDLMTALNNLKRKGYAYNLSSDGNTKSLAIFKNGKRLVINN